MKSSSDRILETPSSYARSHFYYIQEIGILQSLEPHVSRRSNLNSFLFFVVLSGSGTVSIGKTKYSIGSGDCVWIDCSGAYSHESSADDPWSLFWIHYDGPEAASSYSAYVSQGGEPVFKPGNLLVFTESLQKLFDTHKKKASYMELLSNKYITDIVTACCLESAEDQSANTPLSGKLVSVHKYLEAHYKEKVELDLLARTFFVSKYHLSREYRKHYGASITSDLTAIRISHAKSFLRFSDDSVAEIALGCGFQEAGYFIKVFRAQENMTPLEYRKKW